MKINNYKITRGDIDSFYIEVREAIAGQGRDLLALLSEGRRIRRISAKNTRFWQFSQKMLHADFDAFYKVGVRHLARESLREEGSSLEGSLAPEIGVREGAVKVGKCAAMRLGLFAGWGLGYIFYTKPMANLILHEQGHAWAEQLIYHNTAPKTRTNAQYWLDRGDFASYFAGRREGGPGNYCALHVRKDSAHPIALTDWGERLTSNQRKLFIMGGGLGIELLFNTLLAVLGSVAIKKKKRVLGSSLLGLALVSHSAAHSYIRRYYTSGHNLSADPPTLTRLLAKELHLSHAQAFRILDVGYILLPLMVVSAVSLLLLNAPSDIPEEEVLLRMLKESAPESKEHLELALMLKEIEIDYHSERVALEALGETSVARRRKKLLAGKMKNELMKRVYTNRHTCRLFKRTEKAMQKELKGALAAHLPWTYRIRILAALCATFAYALIHVMREVLDKAQPLLSWLCGIFVVASVVSVLVDCTQTLAALRNERLSRYAKGLSVLRTAVSLTATVLICVALFNPLVYPLFLPLLITSSLLGLIVATLQHCEMKRLARFYTQIEETPLWHQMLADAQEHLKAGPALFELREGESREEFRLRLAEAAHVFRWLDSQAEATSLRRLSQEQAAAVAPSLERFNALKIEIPHLHRRLFFARHVTARFDPKEGEKMDGFALESP